jgi:DNA repair protein RecO (recombination protein O)
MDHRVTGIVLRTHLLTETSLIVHWLTQEEGRLATVAKGARRAKSPFRGQMDLFYLCDLSFARSRRSDLHTLREVRLRAAHAALRTELGWLRQAAYGAALVEHTTEVETPLPGVFDLFLGLLEALPAHPPQPLTVLAFEMKLLVELGLGPDLAKTVLTPGARQILEKFRTVNWPELFLIRPSPSQAVEMQRYLHGFLVYHLARVPHSRSAALGA